jgi:hypothetical protein
MTRAAPLPFRPRLATGLAAGLALALLASGPARAQSTVCQEGGKHLEERKGLVSQLNGLGKKRVDPGRACAILTKLTANGQKSIAWLDANKDWCQIPDQFASSFKEDHGRVSDLKGKACQAAAQQAEMMRKARQQAQQQAQGAGGGMLGGPGLTGQYKMPQGAL